jgi:hypothetical protein
MILLQNIIESNYHYQPSWMMVLIALSVMIIGYLFSAFHTRFIELVRAFFTVRFANQLSREEYSLTHPVSVFLSFNFLISCSLFILQLISSEEIFSFSAETDFVSYFILFLLLFLLYVVKIILLKILGFILDKQQALNEYIFTTFLVNQIIAIGFIPVNIFIAYGSPALAATAIYTGVLLMVIAFILKVGKGTLAALSGGGIAPFYLLLYLCTLEILPLLLGYKLIEKLI